MHIRWTPPQLWFSGSTRTQNRTKLEPSSPLSPSEDSFVRLFEALPKSEPPSPSSTEEYTERSDSSLSQGTPEPLSVEDKQEAKRQKRRLYNVRYWEQLKQDPKKLELAREKRRNAQAKYEAKIKQDPEKAAKRKQQVLRAVAKNHQKKKKCAEQTRQAIESRIRTTEMQPTVASDTSQPTAITQERSYTPARSETPPWDEWINFSPEASDREST